MPSGFETGAFAFGGPAADLIPGVKNTIAVASGKGGVGKTTVAVNLAVSLARDGARVGLLDADITGPNVPLMMGTMGAHVTGAGGRVNPVVSHGVTMMSIQYFLTGDAPVIWRGPLIHSAIQQFLRDVDWGELDYLVVDLPPGTGDAALSLSQLIPLTGAVIVTTPQEVSLADARKAIAMFTKVNVRTLGVVENMSGFICPNCGEEHDIFGSRASPRPRRRTSSGWRCRRSDYVNAAPGRRSFSRRGSDARGGAHHRRADQRGCRAVRNGRGRVDRSTPGELMPSGTDPLAGIATACGAGARFLLP